jgi:HAD superfamily hydrolase (TIGR01459 family)
MSELDALDPRFRLILCDIWGVVHDGVHLYAGAAERLRRWRGEGRTIILITNAPRPAEAVEQQLDRIGLPRECWDGLSTSGEAGIAGLKGLGEPVGFLGTAEDRAILADKGVPFASDNEFRHVACTGLEEQSLDTSRYDERLQTWAGDGVTMHCLNPDRLVIRGGKAEACAGALADIFEELGGKVEWYGKPHEAIYRHALGLAGDPAPDQVLAVGDSLQTDVLGAARMGFDCVFVQGGIHAGEPFPGDFARTNGLDDWQPVAIVPSLH